MRTENINGHTLVLYNGIDEMPILNYQKYNKYLLVDAGIGPSVEAIDEKVVMLAKHINAGDKKAAIDELTNLRLSLFMAQNEISPRLMSLIAMCYSIDGEVITDYSDENIKALLAKLQTSKFSSLIELFSQVKKKIESELYVYFPQYFENAKEKDKIAKILNLLRAKLQFIETLQDNTSEIKALEDKLDVAEKPMSFEGKKSVEIEYDKQFESTCLLISQRAKQNPRAMTVLQFYSTLNHVETQLKAEQRAYKKRK